MNCPHCGAPEKEPRDGNTAWFTCGTYRNTVDSKYGRRSSECYLHEEIIELKDEIERLKAFVAELNAEIERLKGNQCHEP